ncbi:MAG: carboxypeptidase-like regulatory domain-containing protein [Bacteroidales bacterium]|nr:carboxypeptidase-like regulatory domain-containing protein [Bacteroidales bacterium]
MMKRLSLVLIVVLISFQALYSFSQTTISGKVTDSQTGEELAGAAIVVKGTTKGTITDLDGNYVLTGLTPGKHVIQCSFVSFTPKEEEIHANGEEIVLDFNLAIEDVSLETVEVIAKKNRESENLLLLEQRNANIIVENIGAGELSRKGAGDVAAGVKKVTGISMMGSRQLFVRGLGDRYNSVQSNKLPLPSPDPQKKVMKLDLFPSDIVQVLEVNKVFSVRNYADYSGALINIETKDYPQDPFLNISIGGGYNTNSTLQPFYRIEAEGNTFMGLDVKKRNELTPFNYKEVNRLMEIGDDFHLPSYNYSNKEALPNIDLGFTGGRRFRLGPGQLGVLVATSFQNEYEYYPDVIDINTNRENGQKTRFVNQEYSYNTYFTNLASITYDHTKDLRFKYDLVFLNNGEDGFKEKKGSNLDWPDADDSEYITRLAHYINYRLLSHQLSGYYHLPGNKWKLQWAGSLSDAGYNVPDRREVIYHETSAGRWEYMTLNNGNDTKRIIVEQDAKDYNFSLNMSYLLNDDKGELVFGGATNYKKLDYYSYFFGYEFDLDENRIVNLDISDPNTYLTSRYVIDINANTSDDMGYKGSRSIYSGFADFVYALTSKWTLNAGVRAEIAEMMIESNTIEIDNDEEQFIFNDVDFFPALNLKCSLTEKTNLRFAASRTVIRPSFYEKTSARLLHEPGDYATFGNPYTKDNVKPSDSTYLENSYSNNIDLKWEWFPSPGELIAIGVYGKQIIEPIESVSRLMGGTDLIYTFENFPDNAYAAGIEFEVKKKIRDLFIGFNASYIYTHLKIPEGRYENQRERSLQGASPYLVNADLGYVLNYGAEKQQKCYAGIVYNVYGKRLYRVGVSGGGNQYELPVNSLDLIIKNKLSNKLDINISIKNILDPDITIIQEVYEDELHPDVKTKDQVIHQYNKGITVKLGFAYKF